MAKRGSLGTEFVASAMMLVFGLFAPAVQPPEQGIEQTREDQVHVDIEKHRKPASGLTLSGNKRRSVARGYRLHAPPQKAEASQSDQRDDPGALQRPIPTQEHVYKQDRPGKDQRENGPQLPGEGV